MVLLSIMQVIYAANVADGDLSNGNAMSKAVFDFAEKDKCTAVRVSAQVSQSINYNIDSLTCVCASNYMALIMALLSGWVGGV